MKSSVIKTLFFALSTFIGFNAFSHQNDEQAHHHHSSEQLMVHSATVRAFLPAAPSTAGYLVIDNPTQHDKILVKASLEGVKRVEIHEHIHKEDMMTMQRVDELTIPAGKSVVFQPGGYHLMVFEPLKTLKVGDKHKLTLYFADGDRVYTMAGIVALADMFGGKAKSDTPHHTHH
ncbi:copper chaperone PCu(A)C [Pseudoalteromonas sp. McH1-7]|uniref:copper chaperone PCu(A)C n=1 Tax=Pseudoalteromonas sp. McH1-7 TaxID=2745574 RepID=UPI00159152BC|nr:copper chaperone PCu(A)C [Pseudoalteromonas sp. McH1-7]NUZ11851.1 copper chaperone PCu(A)C [Pseudoalteromonas sp. McH1-7]